MLPLPSWPSVGGERRDDDDGRGRDGADEEDDEENDANDDGVGLWLSGRTQKAKLNPMRWWNKPAGSDGVAPGSWDCFGISGRAERAEYTESPLRWPLNMKKCRGLEQFGSAALRGVLWVGFVGWWVG